MTSVLTGTPAPESREEKAVMFDYFTKYMGALTLEEIILAVKMNLNGDFGAIIKPYGVLSVSYFAEIVEKYRPVRQIEVRKAKALLAPPEEKSATPEELYNQLIKLYDKLGEFPNVFPHYHRVYEHIISNFEIDLTLERKNQIADQAKRELSTERITRITPELVKNRCYRIVVQEYIEFNT